MTSEIELVESSSELTSFHSLYLSYKSRALTLEPGLFSMHSLIKLPKTSFSDLYSSVASSMALHGPRPDLPPDFLSSLYQ